MRLIAAIAILVILVRSSFYFFITGVFVNANSPVLISNLKDILLLCFIGKLLTTYQNTGPLRIIITVCYFYICVFSVLMLYPLLPEPYCLIQNTAPILNGFNYLSLATSVGLIIYYFLFRKAIAK